MTQDMKSEVLIIKKKKEISQMARLREEITISKLYFSNRYSIKNLPAQTQLGCKTMITNAISEWS